MLIDKLLSFSEHQSSSRYTNLGLKGRTIWRKKVGWCEYLQNVNLDVLESSGKKRSREESASSAVKAESSLTSLGMCMLGN